MAIMDSILSVTEEMPRDMAMRIAARAKERRLEMNLTQEGLSVRAGVKLPTYRKFERTGEISLKGLLQVAFALNALRDFETLFSHRQYQSLNEILSENNVRRKRGRKNE